MYRKNLDTTILQSKTVEYVMETFYKLYDNLPKDKELDDVIGRSQYIMREHRKAEMHKKVKQVIRYPNNWK